MARANRWWDQIDKNNSTASVDLYGTVIPLWVPIRFEACGSCEGKGSYVNPNIDRDGLTFEDFEDRDFADDYMRGTYDVLCGECEGERVAPVYSGDDYSISRGIEDKVAGRHVFIAEVEAEQRMGA